MSEKTRKYISSIVASFPELGHLLNIHLEDNEEVLPHLFMADILRFVLAGGNGASKILEYINHGLKNDDGEIEELLSVSFVENIENIDEIRKIAGKNNIDQIVTEWEQKRRI